MERSHTVQAEADADGRTGEAEADRGTLWGKDALAVALVLREEEEAAQKRRSFPAVAVEQRGCSCGMGSHRKKTLEKKVRIRVSERRNWAN